jgi:hypothetical protein
MAAGRTSRLVNRAFRFDVQPKWLGKIGIFDEPDGENEPPMHVVVPYGCMSGFAPTYRKVRKAGAARAS